MHKQLPNKWKLVKIVDVVEFIRNGLNTQQGDNGTYPISRIETISTGEIDGLRVKYSSPTESEISKYALAEGDILFSHINSVEHLAKTAIYKGYPRNLIHGINLLAIRTNDKILSDYLLHWLKYENTRNSFRAKARKAVNQASINTKDISNIDLPLPPLETQHKIVSILDEADNLRKLRKQADDKIKELIPSLFVDMFGDPVTNPKGWKTRKLGDVVSKDNPQVMPTDYPNEEFTYIGLEHIESNTGNLTCANRDYGRDIKSLKNRFKPEDILYGRLRPYLNKVWLANTEGICSTEILVLTPDQTVATSMYISTWLKLRPIVGVLNSLTEGANLPRVKPSGMNAINIPLPPIDMQKKFSSIAEELSDRCIKHQMICKDTLDALFNSLMDRCMSGEIF